MTAAASTTEGRNWQAEGAQRKIRAWRGKLYRAIVIIMQRGNGQVGRGADSPLEGADSNLGPYAS